MRSAAVRYTQGRIALDWLMPELLRWLVASRERRLFRAGLPLRPHTSPAASGGNC